MSAATRNFDPDDLEDYDDDEDYYDEEESEDERTDKAAVPSGVEKRKNIATVIKPAATQKESSSGGNKMEKKLKELNLDYQPSSWCLESRQVHPATLSAPPTVFVVIGHVDAGKSSLNSRLVSKFGNPEISLMTSLSGKKKAPSLAWELDVGADEREHGVTIDSKSRKLLIANREFVAIDAPGHVDYVPSMLLGAMQADAAVLVIDCVKFESGFSRGGQTKEHVSLVRALGIAQLVVVLNKIDLIEISARFDALESIKAQLVDFFEEIKFTHFSFVPCSAVTGENIFASTNSTNSLETALSALKAKSHGPANHSVCIPIVDVNEDKVSGRIECGSVHAGEKLLVLPSKGIVKFSKTNAGPGAYLESVSVSVVEGGDLGAVIHPGSVLVDANFGLKRIVAVNSFYARILVLNDDFMPLVKGQSVTINCHTAMTEAVIARIVSKEGATAPGKPVKCLVKNDRALVEISLRKGCLIVIEPDCVSRVTGRVVIRDRGVTIAAGRVVTL